MKLHDFKRYPIPYERPTRRREQWAAHDDYKRAMRKDPCSYCFKAGGTVDHIIPSKAGTHPRKLGTKKGPENWTGACLSCNQMKGGFNLLQYLLPGLRS